MSSTPVSRRCRFLTICGSNDPSRSRGNGDLDRADVGQDRLRPAAVAVVHAGVGLRVALVITKAIGDLTLERRLQHPIRQLLKQPTIAGQLQARCTSLFHQPSDRSSPPRQYPRRSLCQSSVSYSLIRRNTVRFTDPWLA
jgi:hypothetical protein